MVYADYQLGLQGDGLASLPHTNPIWDTVREMRMDIRIYFPYRAPPISNISALLSITLDKRMLTTETAGYDHVGLHEE